jgi:hypothetical protein
MPNYPTSLDALTNPSGSDTLNSGSVPHSVQHSTLNDIVEALEAKLGTHATANAISQFMTLAGTGAGLSRWGYHGAVALAEASGSAASYDFQSMSQNFRHLLLLAFVRSNTAAATTPLLARFNNDSGSNYDFQTLSGANATAGAAASIGQTYMQLGTMSAANAAVGAPGLAAILVPYYTQTIPHGALSLAGHKSDNTAASLGVAVHRGDWRTSAAITRVTLLPGAGSFSSDSLVTLYGLGQVAA